MGDLSGHHPRQCHQRHHHQRQAQRQCLSLQALQDAATLQISVPRNTPTTIVQAMQSTSARRLAAAVMQQSQSFVLKTMSLSETIQEADGGALSFKFDLLSRSLYLWNAHLDLTLPTVSAFVLLTFDCL